MLKFGQTIKSKREEKGWTQKELAEKLFVTDKAVSRWENDKSYPDITLLLEIAAVLEFDYQELLEGQKYVQRQMDQKRKNKNLAIISIVLIFSFIVMFGFSMNKRSENLGKGTVGIDYLNSMTWDTLFIIDKRGDTSIAKIISDYQSATILDCLDVDSWEKVENVPESWGNGEQLLDRVEVIYCLEFQNDIKLEEYYVFKDQGKYYVVFATEFYYGGVFNTLMGKGNLTHFYEIYSCESDLTHLMERIKKIPEFEFNYSHELENTTNFRLLSEQEILEMEEAYYKHDESRNIIGGKILLSKNGPFYLYFTSNEENVTKVSFENGILQLEGSARKYTKPYVCVFEIVDPDSILEIHYNGERIFGYGYDFRNEQ